MPLGSLSQVSSRRIANIFFTSLLDYIAFATIVPLLPIIFLNSPWMESYSIESRYFLLGLLYAIYPLAQLLSNPILGAFSDRVSRKLIFLISYSGDAIGYFLFGYGVLSHQIPLMFLGFFIAGLTGCNVAMSNAYIGDRSAGPQKIRRFIFLNILMGTAFVVGPLLGKHIPVLLCFFGGSALSLFNALLLYFTLDDRSLFKKGEIQIPSVKTLFYDISHLYSGKKYLLNLGLSLFLLFFGWYLFIKFFQIYLISSGSFLEDEIFYIVSYCGLCTILTQMLYSFVVAKSKVLSIKTFIFCLGLSIFSLAFVHSIWLILLIVPLFSAAYSLLCPSLLFLISEEGGNGAQGKLMGLYTSVQSLAKVFAPLLMGLTMQVWWKLPLFIACGFIFGSVLFLQTKRSTSSPGLQIKT